MAQIKSLKPSLPPSVPYQPGRVVELRGIILQSDAVSVLGAWIIRPVETLDMRLAGLGRSPGAPALAMCRAARRTRGWKRVRGRTIIRQSARRFPRRIELDAARNFQVPRSQRLGCNRTGDRISPNR